MKTLNLIEKRLGEIQYEISKYPDGQQSVTIYGDKRNCFSYLIGEDIEVTTRLRSFLDLEILISCTSSLKEAGVNEIHLFITYFLGGRSDRKFLEGSSNYLKTVICPIINLQNYKTVTVYEPHSDGIELCLNGFKKGNTNSMTEFVINDIKSSYPLWEIVLVSPDGGALKRVYKISETFKIKNVVEASKYRDIETGKITRTNVIGINQFENVVYLIPDDICDGGRTFIEISKTIKNIKPTAPIILMVYHGIFSNGLSPILENIDKIYTTNSYRDDIPKSDEKFSNNVKIFNIL